MVKKTQTKRPGGKKVNSLVKSSYSAWKKNFFYASKKSVASKWGVFAIIFFVGALAAISTSVYYNIQSKSKAATGTAQLSWNANTESDLAGYKVYYGTSKRTCNHPDANRCGYASVVDVHKVNSYTVGGLTEGQTYYFSITAYDTSNNESDFSIEGSKAIPVTQTTCSSFSYSSWGTCQSNGTQTRTVLSSSPTGCTGGTPVLTQSCTYNNTCTSFTYSAWGTCQPDGTQTRSITSSTPSGCTGGSPVISQTCTPDKEVTTCTSFSYSKWSACISGTRTRTVINSTPSGCTGGTPITSQACSGGGKKNR